MITINIRIEDLKRLRFGLDSKQVKAKKELLALAILMKGKHSNGAILRLSKNYIRKNFGVGKVKAERLMGQMRESDMFTVADDARHGGLRVQVATFRDKTTKRKKSRKGRLYRSDDVCRFTFSEDSSLKDIYNLINEKLMLLPISSANRKDCLRKGGDKNPSCSVANPVSVTMRAFAKTIGMGVASVSRIKKRLLEREVITSTYAEKHSADLRNKVEADRLLMRLGKHGFTYTYGDFGYVLIPCKYSIVAHDGESIFYHKMFNYKSSNDVKNQKANPSGGRRGKYAFMVED